MNKRDCRVLCCDLGLVVASRVYRRDFYRVDRGK